MKIQSSVQTIELDENFREAYMEIIERFFQLFESIYNYYKDFKTFISNVHEGYFIDYNLESIL
jgi:WASH complex subunit strumpellin